MPSVQYRAFLNFKDYLYKIYWQSKKYMNEIIKNMDSKKVSLSSSKRKKLYKFYKGIDNVI